jgi:hypothetical protein
MVMPKFMITVRSIADGAFAGGAGKVRYLSGPDDAAPLPAHEITLHQMDEEAAKRHLQMTTTERSP